MFLVCNVGRWGALRVPPPPPLLADEPKPLTQNISISITQPAATASLHGGEVFTASVPRALTL